jgi:iron complex outermembrane receptor protein
MLSLSLASALRRPALLFLALALSTGRGQTAAKDDAADSANDKTVTLNEFVVTGSNIPTSAEATASPVTVIGNQQIQRTGVDNNMLDLLRKQLPSIAGRSNIGSTNANNVNQITLGGSQIAIRNLDTLVLIDGRRVATNGANGIRGKNFVDVNMIPASAVERVEVLTDGASAIYGSDAVGGVINFILKSNYKGAEFGSRIGWSTGAGNYGERSAYLVAGAGGNGVNVTVSANWTKNTPLFQKDRPFSHSITGRNSILSGVIGSGTVFPTDILNPTLNSPRQSNPVGSAATATSLAALVANGTYLPSTSATISAAYNSALYTTLLLGQEQRSGLISSSAELAGKKLVAFADAIYGKTKSTYQLPALTNTLTEAAGAPYNPLTVSFPRIGFQYLPAPLQYTEDSKSIWASGGLRGEISPRWSWEAAYTYNDNRLTQYVKNVYYTPNLVRDLAGGYNSAGTATAGGGYSRVISGFSEENGTFVIQPALDPFARAAAVDPASLSNLLGTSSVAVGSKLGSADLKLVGTPFDLPGGKLGVAVGGSTRKEEITGQPDANSYVSGPTAGRWTGASSFDPFDQSRRVNSGFAEVRVPVTGPTWTLPAAHALDLSFAYRVERYSDVGSSRVPKYSVRWQPIDDQLTLRYTYAASFTAPGLYFLSGPSSQSLTTAATIPTALGSPGQANNYTTNNPGLKPSTAVTRSAGFVFSPRAIKNLTLTLDYVSASQWGVVGGPGAGVILSTTDRLGGASPYLGNVTFNNFPGRPGAVQITQVHQLSDYLKNGGSASNIYLTSNFINLSGAKVRAFDATVEYELPTPTFGKFGFSSTATIFQSYKFKALPEQPYYEYVGYATNGGTGQQGTIPRYRTYSVLDWSRRSWRAMVGMTHVPAVTDIGVGGDTYANSTTTKPVRVNSYTTWDLQLGYTINGRKTPHWWALPRETRLTLGVNNVFNRMPPLAPQAFTDSFVDPATYGLIGRLIFVSAAIKF